MIPIIHPFYFFFFWCPSVRCVLLQWISDKSPELSQWLQSVVRPGWRRTQSYFINPLTSFLKLYWSWNGVDIIDHFGLIWSDLPRTSFTWALVGRHHLLREVSSVHCWNITAIADLLLTIKYEKITELMINFMRQQPVTHHPPSITQLWRLFLGVNITDCVDWTLQSLSLVKRAKEPCLLWKRRQLSPPSLTTV